MRVQGTSSEATLCDKHNHFKPFTVLLPVSCSVMLNVIHTEESNRERFTQKIEANTYLTQALFSHSQANLGAAIFLIQSLTKNLLFSSLFVSQPPTQNINLGPGGMSQSASNQSLHSQSNLSDAIGTGLPPSSLMQSQISNGELWSPLCCFAVAWQQDH